MKREDLIIQAIHWQKDAATEYKLMCIARNDGNVVECIKHQHTADFGAYVARRRLFLLIGNGESE